MNKDFWIEKYKISIHTHTKNIENIDKATPANKYYREKWEKERQQSVAIIEHSTAELRKIKVINVTV